ncbi:MAG: hypothetical protein HW418_1244, partial [Anaerolineales bacterium]|nr:hypothetical protein [Anaerolineales bacterium]
RVCIPHLSPSPCCASYDDCRSIDRSNEVVAEAIADPGLFGLLFVGMLHLIIRQMAYYLPAEQR